MLKGEYVYIRAVRNEGTGKESKKAYDIGKITLSDGLESVEHNIKPNLVPTLFHLSKGDKVQIEIEATSGYKSTNYEVVKVLQIQSK